MNRNKRSGVPDRSPEQVKYMQSLKVTSRYVHISCRAEMRPDPYGLGVMVPWIERPGHTFRHPRV